MVGQKRGGRGSLQNVDQIAERPVERGVDRPRQPTDDQEQDEGAARLARKEQDEGKGVARQHLAVARLEQDIIERQGIADLGADARHAALDRRAVTAPDHARCAQHAGMRERSLYVEFREPAVETDRGGVALDEIGDRLVEAPGPWLGASARTCLLIGSHDAC